METDLIVEAVEAKHKALRSNLNLFTADVQYIGD